VNKFDAAFFGVHYKQAHTMDPMCRIILEKSYEAIVDSGKKFNIINYIRLTLDVSNRRQFETLGLFGPLKISW